MNAYLNIADAIITPQNSSEYTLNFTESYEDCFIKALANNAEIIMQVVDPVCKIQDLFSSLENYDSIPTMLLFYVCNDNTIIYAMSNAGKNSSNLRNLFFEIFGDNYKNIFDSFYDKTLIANQEIKNINIRFEQTRRYEYLIELSRGIIKDEFIELKKIMNFNLTDHGYYIYAWILHENSDCDYIHHATIKNIYYLIGAILQKECEEIINRYDGGEVFYDGTRKLFVIINSSSKSAKNIKRLNEQVTLLTSALGTMDANRYMGNYIDNIESFREGYESLMKLRKYTFFLRDAQLITYDLINNECNKPNMKTVNEYIEKIQHMLIYDTSNPQIISLIQVLLLVIIKPSYDYDLYAYCYANISSAIYQKITLGYHNTPGLYIKGNPNMQHSFIEVECNRLCEMVQKIQSNPQTNIPASKNSLINQAVDFIKRNYDKDISLVSISDYLNISSVYLSQLFKKEIGVSPVKFIIEYRINQAKILLKNTDNTVYNIAIKVGFWEQKHFSKSFKRITGQTPTQFRQNLYNK